MLRLEEAGDLVLHYPENFFVWPSKDNDETVVICDPSDQIWQVVVKWRYHSEN